MFGIKEIINRDVFQLKKQHTQHKGTDASARIDALENEVTSDH
jgi:hypothetical protein